MSGVILHKEDLFVAHTPNRGMTLGVNTSGHQAPHCRGQQLPVDTGLTRCGQRGALFRTSSWVPRKACDESICG
eukprot:scaffold8110_cov403-Prasinococcus_capsulatus_cf.AAC.1